MTNEMISAKLELKELVDSFSNFADTKDAISQANLFTPDGILEFQIGFEGDIHKIVGRETLVNAFSSTLNPCKALYHINGQHNIKLNDDIIEANGISYCQAILVNEVNGKDIMTTNYIRYVDHYVKIENKWYIKCRRSIFLVSDKHNL